MQDTPFYFSGGSGGMTSGLDALLTTVMKDSELPTSGFTSPVDISSSDAARQMSALGQRLMGWAFSSIVCWIWDLAMRKKDCV